MNSVLPDKVRLLFWILAAACLTLFRMDKLPNGVPLILGCLIPAWWLVNGVLVSIRTGRWGRQAPDRTDVIGSASFVGILLLAQLGFALAGMP